MKQSGDEKINFENIIITPLEKWVDTDFELEPRVIEELKLLAEKSNQSIDNVLIHILEDFFSEHLELSQLNAESLQKTAERSPLILILQNGNPIARVKMLIWGDGKNTFSSEKTPHKKKEDSKQKEPVANCNRFASEAAIYDPYIYSEENMKHLRQGIEQVEMDKRRIITQAYKHL